MDTIADMAMDQDSARRNFRDITSFAGLTARQVAEAAGISVSAIYNWQKANNPANLGTVALGKIADALGVTIQELFREPPQRGAGDADDEIRVRALQQIDDLLAGIDDAEEQTRAANIIIATLRATRDEFERKRNPPRRP